MISLRENPSKEIVAGADYHIEPGPEPLLAAIADIVSRKNSCRVVVLS